ncbi:uncharacterized protein METZ01_LOCUS308733, partial [marine metagenome]
IYNMIRMLITVLISINLFYLAFAQDTIEGRWHLVGYEDNVMYQFEDNYRYSIYSLDGTFGGLEDAGGSPNPYTVEEDIITIDLFFGIIVNYQMNFMCDGQVVEFKNIDYGTIHSTHFREGYDYQESPCNDNSTLDEGDLNGDDIIDILDIIILVNMILDDEYNSIADLNEDGELNILDVVTIVNLVLFGDDDTCIDIDGNIYETVQIDEQLWMAENLKVTHYNNGDEIPNITSNSSWLSIFTGAYGDYDNNPANSETYGRLYNWYTVDDDRGVCPDGWHVPSDEAYTILIDYLGGTSVAGGKMKETGLEHWYSPNAGATNESGFTGLPSGFRYWADGNYYYMGEYNYFWTSSEGFEPPYAPFRTLRYDDTWVY